MTNELPYPEVPFTPGLMHDIPQEDGLAIEEISEQTPTLGSRAYQVGTTAVKAGVIGFELMPVTNEGFRFGALALALTQTDNPYIAAGVLGASTFMVEGSGVVAAADWVARDRIGQVVDSIDERLQRWPRLHKVLSPKRLTENRTEMSMMSQVGVAFTLGNVALMEAKQRVDPTRTAEQNKSYGLKMTALMSGVFAVEGALIAEGIDNIDSPVTWTAGAAVLGLAVGGGAIKRGAKRLWHKIHGTDLSVDESEGAK